MICILCFIMWIDGIINYLFQCGINIDWVTVNLVGYFYLVDSGYGCSLGFMPPYRNERYHLASFCGRRGGPSGKLETFNYRHSLLRSIVERAFRIMKRRFRILDRMNPYSTDFQLLIIVACCCIHNFIRKDCGESDELFKEALQQMYGE
jgi:hypothetical protein